MIKHAFVAGVTALALAFVAADSKAATVQLGLTVTGAGTGNGTWALTALISGANKGLANFSAAVTGNNNGVPSGANVTTSALPTALRPANTDPATMDDVPFIGFADLRAAGTTVGNARIGINAAQHTVGDASSLSDSFLLFNLGTSTPVTIATGAWTAPTNGPAYLTGQLNTGFFFNVFPSNYTAGGPVETATSVLPSPPVQVGVVPEPTTFALAGMGLVGLAAFARRRKES